MKEKKRNNLNKDNVQNCTNGKPFLGELFNTLISKWFTRNSQVSSEYGRRNVDPFYGGFRPIMAVLAFLGGFGPYLSLLRGAWARFGPIYGGLTRAPPECQGPSIT